MGKYFFIICCLLILKNTVVLSQNYTRTGDYNRFNLSVNDLQNIVKSIAYYTDLGSNDSVRKSHYTRFDCTLSNKTKSLSYTQLTQINKIEKLPENFTDLTISYSSDKSEINSIKLILNNSYRNFSVTGTDGKKTDAIFRDISEQISSKIGFFAFVPWNMILSIISMAVIWACSVFGVTTIIQSRKTGGRTLYWGIFLSILSLIAFCIFLTQISSDSPLFPGFSILSDEVEWYNKYGNLITLISIIISIVVSIGPIISWAKNKKVIRN